MAVPSPAEGVEREVAFLFEALDVVEARAREVRDAARAQATAIEAGARARRSLLLAQATDQGNQVWNELIAARRATYQREADAILADAQRTAAGVLARGHAATPAVVGEVVRRIEAPEC
jgi:vacuolar-type H+-ATPase subunit H